MVCMAGVSAFAVSFTVDGLYYKVISETEVQIEEDFFPYTGAIFVPATVTYNEVTYTVRGITGTAFSNCPELTSITVDPNNQYYSSIDGVLFSKDGTRLLQVPGAFTTYKVSADVTYIAPNAFFGCINLIASVEEGNEWFEVDGGVLYEKDGEGNKIDILFIPSSIVNLTIPEGITSFTTSTIVHCTKLETMYISSSVQEIDNYFFMLTALESITVNEGNQTFKSSDGSLLSKDGKVFLNCPCAKASVSIPESVEEIDDFGFVNCAKLTTVNIPAAVKSIGNVSFNGCTSLESITVSAGNQYFTSANGVLFDKDRHVLYLCPAKKESMELDCVPEIKSGAFRDFTGTLTITLTDTEKPYVKENQVTVFPANMQVNYVRTLASGKIGTIVLWFIPDNADDFCFYKLSSETETTLDFERVKTEDLMLCTPYLYKNADDDNIVTTMHVTNPGIYDIHTYMSLGDKPSTANWQMNGTLTEKTLTDQKYFVLSDNAFRCSSSSVELAPFRAWLEYNGVSEAKPMDIFLDGSPTGIRLIEADAVSAASGQMFNLSGQKVDAAYRGIVIKDGKTILNR